MHWLCAQLLVFRGLSNEFSGNQPTHFPSKSVVPSKPITIVDEQGQQPAARHTSSHSIPVNTVSHTPAPAVAPTLRRPGWRKYGQKRLSNNQVTSYYRCSVQGCPVKRQVLGTEDGMGEPIEVRLFGHHTHHDGLLNVQELGVSRKRKRKEASVGAQELNPPQSKPNETLLQTKDIIPVFKTEEPESASLEELPGMPPAAAPHLVPQTSGVSGPALDAQFASRLLGASPAFVTTDMLQPGAPIVSVSPGFVALTGYSREDVIGQPLQSIQVSADQDQTSEGHGVILCSRKNAPPFWCLTNTADFQGSTGQVVANVIFMTNVSQVEPPSSHGVLGP